MGKLATRAGVQVNKAVYANEGTGHTIDLFAKSEPGQKLIISGTGIAQTEMRADGAGGYYGRIFADGTPPADLAVTNVTDNPRSVDHVDPSLFGDKVHVISAIYDNDTQKLVVEAQSGDNARPSHCRAIRLRSSAPAEAPRSSRSTASLFRPPMSR
jgi:hypothetical protein